MQNEKITKLSEKSQSVLRTLCSNYRGNTRVIAQFRCSVHYGLKKFLQEVEKNLKDLKKAGCILSFSFSDEETDEETDLCYFNVNADLNLSLEDMAEISLHSQTIFKA